MREIQTAATRSCKEYRGRSTRNLKAAGAMPAGPADPSFSVVDWLGYFRNKSVIVGPTVSELHK